MARLHVDPKYVNANINELIWGSFTEHLGRCIYGGLYQPDHATADDNGLRQDVIDEVKGLDISLVRYPGGNYVSNYNWKDGIGPKEKRPRRLEFAWATIESNQFGIDDFIDWARKANVEPMIAVNLGTPHHLSRIGFVAWGRIDFRHIRPDSGCPYLLGNENSCFPL